MFRQLIIYGTIFLNITTGTSYALSCAIDADGKINCPSVSLADRLPSFVISDGKTNKLYGVCKESLPLELTLSKQKISQLAIGITFPIFLASSESTTPRFTEKSIKYKINSKKYVVNANRAYSFRLHNNTEKFKKFALGFGAHTLSMELFSEKNAKGLSYVGNSCQLVIRKKQS